MHGGDENKRVLKLFNCAIASNSRPVMDLSDASLKAWMIQIHCLTQNNFKGEQSYGVVLQGR